MRGVADDECMAASARAAADRRLISLKAERDQLAGVIERSAAGSAALGRVIVGRAQDAIEPAGAFMREWDAFQAAMWREFRGDVIRLPLSQFFTKWFCILDGLGFPGLVAKLKETKISAGSPVFFQGVYHLDTGEKIDCERAASGRRCSCRTEPRPCHRPGVRTPCITAGRRRPSRAPAGGRTGTPERKRAPGSPRAAADAAGRGRHRRRGISSPGCNSLSDTAGSALERRAG